MFWKKKPPDPYLQKNVDALIDNHTKLTQEYNSLESSYWGAMNELQDLRSRVKKMEIIRDDLDKTAEDVTVAVNDAYVKAWSSVSARDVEIRRYIKNVLFRMLEGE